MTRLVVANLDAEAEFAGRGSLSDRARDAAAAWGALLGAGGDVVALVPGDAPVERSGDAADLVVTRAPLVDAVAESDPTALLAWCETPSVARARAGRPVEAPWAARHEAGSPAAVAAGHHRRFALDAARELGAALADAQWIADGDDLPAAPDGPTGLGWVAKAGFSAAGRDRWRGRLDEPGRAQAAAFVARHGGALVEPWCARVADLGWVGWIGAGGEVAGLGSHRLEVDAGGRFAGVDVGPGLVAPADAARLDDVGLHVGRRLAALGLRGGYGVDAWVWRRADGRAALHPLGEVNARLTMAHVARLWAARWGVDSVRLDVAADAPPTDRPWAAVRVGASSARVVAT